MIEEILDWRPFDYLSQRNTLPTPEGPVKFLSTIEFEPTADGTAVHIRYAEPRSARERAILGRMDDSLASLFAETVRVLTPQLDVDAAARLTEDVALEAAS